VLSNVTYLLTPWIRILLEKLTGFQVVKKFPAFYWTRKFITVFTNARHLSLSWASSIHSRSYRCISPGPKLSAWTFRNRTGFYDEELLGLGPSPKLEDHTVSAVRDCLFNIFATTLHIGYTSSIRNPRTRHAVVTGTHLSRAKSRKL
jgi:hypothetical protein